MHIDNKKKDVLILGKGTTDCVNDTILTAAKLYHMTFTEQQNKF